MYLLDTNFVSELRKGPRANPGVRRFLEDEADGALYLPVQVIGELRRGVHNVRTRGDKIQARLLEEWLDDMVDSFQDRLIVFDVECAQLWGTLMVPCPHHPIDKQIAAVALIHDMTVVTRNVDDFRPTGAKVLNPFR
ncbi:Ribonuclease VapC [Bordetella sputigena]|uniref:type II toxin-antitoxin system VapC family toxin n=1 Tax=Bordetella sputigena TaxID=1416810 RepID=UPI0039EFC821